MLNKVTDVRHYVLNLLEEGKLKAGQRLPGARELALTLGISFLKVQQAVETLCQDGVLETVSRKGTFVQAGWEKRILRENLAVYNKLFRMPWIGGLLSELNQEIGGLRTTFAFEQGMLEIRTTRHVLVNQGEYMDIGGIFAECYPDKSVFFEGPMKPFTVNGRMVGIPLAFSPRVIFFNPGVFERANCPLPRAGWTWDEFMETVRILKRSIPRDRIINWHTQFFLWVNFVVRSGGGLFSPNASDPVMVDHPNTLSGLRRFAELGAELGHLDFNGDDFQAAFLRGEAAMHIDGRQQLHALAGSDNKTWSVAPMPLMPGGLDVTAQATDLICVRTSCTSPTLARKYVQTMLSERVQDYLAQAKQNIPIRKSSAFKSIDLGDPRDALFAVEMGKISTAFNLGEPYPGALISDGICLLLDRNANLEEGLSELARFARIWLKIRG
jgi:hypothetical protein